MGYEQQVIANAQAIQSLIDNSKSINDLPPISVGINALDKISLFQDSSSTTVKINISDLTDYIGVDFVPYNNANKNIDASNVEIIGNSLSARTSLNVGKYQISDGVINIYKKDVNALGVTIKYDSIYDGIIFSSLNKLKIESTIEATNLSGINTGDQDLTPYQLISEKNAINGYAGLDASGKINPNQLPSIAISDTFVVNSQAEMLALTAQTGDVAVRNDESKSYILQGTDPTVLTDWQELLSPTGSVQSVFGRTGVVTAQANDYTWAQIDKTTSSLADITNRNYSDLQNIPTNLAYTDINNNFSVGQTVIGGGFKSTNNNTAYIELITDASNVNYIKGFGNGLTLTTIGSYSTTNGSIKLSPQQDSHIINTATGVGTIKFQTGGFDRLYINYDGNIGIKSGAFAPNSLLTIGETGEQSTLSVTGISTGTVISFRDIDGETFFRSSGSMATDDLLLTMGDYDDSYSFPAFVISTTNSHFLNTKVGINTATPEEALHIVNGTLKLTEDGASNYLKISTLVGSNNFEFRTRFNGLHFYTGDGGNVPDVNFTPGTTGSFKIHLGGNTDEVIFKPDGTVGFGIASPIRRLELNGGIRLSSGNIYRPDNAGVQFQILNGSTLNYGTSQIGALKSILMYDNSTDLTTKKATIFSKSYTNTEEDVAVLGVVNGVSSNILYLGSSGGAVLDNHPTHIIFNTGSSVSDVTGTEAMRISYQYVGIGEQNPLYHLDIATNTGINISGSNSAIYFQGSTQNSGGSIQGDGQNLLFRVGGIGSTAKFILSPNTSQYLEVTPFDNNTWQLNATKSTGLKGTLDLNGIAKATDKNHFDIYTTDGALIVPRLTTVQRDGLTGVDGMIIYNTTTSKFEHFENGAWVQYSSGGSTIPKVVQISVSDETSNLTVGSKKVTFRVPYAMTLTEVRASLSTASSGTNLLTVDINKGITSILSTKLTIDSNEKTSVTATTPAVISDNALADDEEITIDIDLVGEVVPGKGLKVTLIGN